MRGTGRRSHDNDGYAGGLCCSFCGKSQREVKKLIAGPTVYICDECIGMCNDIMREHTTGVAQNPPLYFPRSAVIDAGLVTDFFRTHLSGRPLDMTTMREVLDAYAAALQEESLRATETEKAQRAAATAARVRQAEAEATLPEHRKP